MFIREDWSMFRNLTTITHKAGVPINRLMGLVLKEIADNALDAAPGKTPRFGMDGDFYFVEDDGSGIPGTPEEIAKLFSIKRPLTSSKILRLPTRGALGNGTRVIAGTILASGGELRVHTRGKKFWLDLHDDGTTTVASMTDSKVKGTRIEVKFGKSLPQDPSPWRWVSIAVSASFASTYSGRSSVWWYDSDSFYELIMAAGNTPVMDMLGNFDGFSNKHRALELELGEDAEKPCNQITRERADEILSYLRKTAKQISPKSIGRLREHTTIDYCCRTGEIEIQPGRGQHKAILPYCVEVGFNRKKNPKDDDTITTLVNGTPITGSMVLERRNKSEIALFGCGLHHRFKNFPKIPVSMVMNVTIPYMPITTDGKEPDLNRFNGAIQEGIGRAGKSLRASIRREVGTKVSILAEHLDEAVAKASGDGSLRFSLRQLYYALRPYVLESGDGAELDYNYFARWVGEYEAAYGEIKGMYRDPRGTLYHPHTGETISIGTIAVEEYERPKWAFRNILYIEKEGLFEVLKQAEFPERYDCALLSSKGFASRAVRDLIDMLADGDEEIHVYAIHDADGPGTLIYESLMNETLARGRRKVKIHNLGLEPWEGVKMGLQVESFSDKRSKVPVAQYIKDRRWSDDREDDEEDWEDWLQSHRIELNAMTSPQFLQWLTDKFEKLGVKKVLPPETVVTERLRGDVEAQVRADIAADILAAGGYEKLVKSRMGELDKPLSDAVGHRKAVAAAIDKNAEHHWTAPVKEIATRIARKTA
jgi:hypothetical protein